MLYAVVDIETTGGYAAKHGITEIAIYIHDGVEVIERFETLINPYQYVPPAITALTGITNEMLADAPEFRSVAPAVFDLLKDKVFVAHNVQFDYSFVLNHLEACGYLLNVKKLCTVRLSRKLFPGLPSYSLGKLCASLDIPLHNRHRAGGDTAATAILLSKLLAKDQEGHVNTMLKKNSKEQNLPQHLQKSDIDKLPQQPGVYYFKDQKGKVIYVGKAKNIKKRVCTHFTGDHSTKQRQNFLRNIYHIDFEICGTELMAFILEAAEIKKLWPENNRAMKRFEQKYALYDFEDQNGYIRLGIDKYRSNARPLYSFNHLLEGHQLLRTLIKEYTLCEKLCFIQKKAGSCLGCETGHCFGACTGQESMAAYNIRVNEAILYLQQLLPSFMLIDQGRNEDEKSCLWIEKGKFYGMGYISAYSDIHDMEELKSTLNPYPSNDYIMHLILSHQQTFPHKAIQLRNT